MIISVHSIIFMLRLTKQYYASVEYGRQTGTKPFKQKAWNLLVSIWLCQHFKKHSSQSNCCIWDSICMCDVVIHWDVYFLQCSVNHQRWHHDDEVTHIIIKTLFTEYVFISFYTIQMTLNKNSLFLNVQTF